jgi:hypothetical protein
MTRLWLASTAALTLLAGAAMAQTTTETTTTESTAPYVAAPVVPVPVAPSVTQTTRERTVDSNGMVSDHAKTIANGTTISPYGDATTTRRTVETTTTR